MTQNFEGRPHSLERNYLQDVHRGQYPAVLHQVGCAVEQRLCLAHDPGLLILVHWILHGKRRPLAACTGLETARSHATRIACAQHCRN